MQTKVLIIPVPPLCKSFSKNRTFIYNNNLKSVMKNLEQKTLLENETDRVFVFELGFCGTKE